MTNEELKAYLNNLFPLPSIEDAFHYTYEDRGEFIKTEILRRLEEGEKYKAFWEQSREADKMTFEKYVWNTIHAKPLPEDMNKVLHDNLNDLYEK